LRLVSFWRKTLSSAWETRTPDTIRAFQSPSLSRGCLWSWTERWSLKVTGVKHNSEANNPGDEPLGGF